MVEYIFSIFSFLAELFLELLSGCHPAGTSLDTDVTLIIVIVSVAACITLIILILAAVSKYTNDTVPL